MPNVIDHFNRANGAIGSAETGQVWSGAQWSVESNYARRTGGSNGTWVGGELLSNVGSPDAEVGVTVLGNILNMSIALRASGVVATGTYYLIVIASTSFYIYRALNYAYTTLASVTGLSVIGNPRVNVVIRGQTITVFRNSVQVLTYTDSNTTLSGNSWHGISAYYTYAGFSIVDDLVIMPSLVKVWNGAEWTGRWAKTWDGAAWRAHPVRRWDGVKWA